MSSACHVTWWNIIVIDYLEQIQSTFFRGGWELKNYSNCRAFFFFPVRAKIRRIMSFSSSWRRFLRSSSPLPSMDSSWRLWKVSQLNQIGPKLLLHTLNNWLNWMQVIIPWKSLFTSIPVYAYWNDRFVEGWSQAFLLACLPLYIKGTLVIYNLYYFKN